MLASAIAAAPGQACTLWGAAGSASAEGTLLVKNRDWRPDHVQSLRLVRPDDGLAYVGLYADTGGDVGLKGGVNQAGLSVVSASASSLPKVVRQENHEQHGVIAEILRRYRSLDEVDAHAPAIFAQAKPMFLMLADATGLMRVEIGQDDSLWRNGKEYTLASWQIALPVDGTPRLVLVMANPGEERRKIDLKLHAAFWARPAAVLLGRGE